MSRNRNIIIADDNQILKVEVLQSAAGYYIGTFHPEEGPYTRESSIYYKTREEAQYALDNDLWPSRTIPWYAN